MQAPWLIRILVLIALVGSIAFTPARIRITVDVSVAGDAQEAAKAIAAELRHRGGEFVTSPTGAEGYLVQGISVSLSPGDRTVALEASRTRGAGCSGASLRQDEDSLFAILDQVIAEVSRKSGISLQATRRKEPNSTSGLTSTHVGEPDLAAVVALARTKALESGLVRAEEVPQVRDAAPKVSYYFLSRPLADYSVQWALGAEKIVVHGRGDFFKLENATVERVRAP